MELPELPKRVRPLGDRIIVMLDNPEEVTAGGIIIPDAYRKVQQQGYVVLAGPGGKDYTMSVQRGSKVLFPVGMGDMIKFEKKEYFIMRETDIFAILKK